MLIFLGSGKPRLRSLQCPGYRVRMDQDEAMTAVNVCRAVGLFHMHGPQAMVRQLGRWGRGWGWFGVLLFCKDWRYLVWQLIKYERSKKADGRYAISPICVVVGCFFFCKGFFCRIHFVFFFFRVLECAVTPKQACRMIFRMIVCMSVIVL